MLTAQRHGIAGSGIATLARLTIVQRETAKTSNLNALTGGQRLRHVVNQQFNSQLNVFCAQLALTVGHQVN
jgi:hypothetical protein